MVEESFFCERDIFNGNTKQFIFIYVITQQAMCAFAPLNFIIEEELRDQKSQIKAHKKKYLLKLTNNKFKIAPDRDFNDYWLQACIN